MCITLFRVLPSCRRSETDAVKGHNSTRKKEKSHLFLVTAPAPAPASAMASRRPTTVPKDGVLARDSAKSFPYGFLGFEAIPKEAPWLACSGRLHSLGGPFGQENKKTTILGGIINACAYVRASIRTLLAWPIHVKSTVHTPYCTPPSPSSFLALQQTIRTLIKGKQAKQALHLGSYFLFSSRGPGCSSDVAFLHPLVCLSRSLARWLARCIEASAAAACTCSPSLFWSLCLYLSLLV